MTNVDIMWAYWNIGQLIVEDEQKGERRAKYGEKLLDDMGRRLINEFGRGFSVANLKNFRQFFLVFPKGYHEGEVPADEKGYTVCSELSWSHYRLLMRVEDPAARGYYIGESISQNWSVRALLRQIDSLYFERLLISRDRDAVVTEVKEVTHPLTRRPEEFTLVTSEAITEELSKIPDINKRLRVEKIVSIAQEHVLIDEGITSRMYELIAMGGDAMDSLHIACAERAGAVFLTTDDDLITFFKLHQNIQVHIENPVTWLKEENR